jgi:hypothetical protein
MQDSKIFIFFKNHIRNRTHDTTIHSTIINVVCKCEWYRDGLKFFIALQQTSHYLVLKTNRIHR